MDSDAQPTGTVAVPTLSCDQPTEPDRDYLSHRSTLIVANVTQAIASPEASKLEPLKLHQQLGLTALIGTLSLRVIRSHYNS